MIGPSAPSLVKRDTPPSGAAPRAVSLAQNIATLLNLPERKVRVIYYEGSGSTAVSPPKTPVKTQRCFARGGRPGAGPVVASG